MTMYISNKVSQFKPCLIPTHASIELKTKELKAGKASPFCDTRFGEMFGRSLQSEGSAATSSSPFLVLNVLIFSLPCPSEEQLVRCNSIRLDKSFIPHTTSQDRPKSVFYIRPRPRSSLALHKMDYRSQKCPTPQQLHEYAAWIRDDLDPAIAREGPEIMAPDDVITLHELFLELQRCTPSVTALKYSRIHYAIMDISGKATRWPSKLADECDSIIRAWERVYGSLNQIRSQLYGPGGRLWRICAQRDLTREVDLNI